jgi:hypothetical protein
VAEQDRAQHDFLGQPVCLGLDHQHRVLRARHDEVQVGLRLDLGSRRVEEVLAVLVTDARGTDRRSKGNARQRDGGGGADQRGNVGIDLGVERKDRRDDLDLVVEALGKQRPQRPVDQARGERLLFGRPAFTLEEPPRDLAGRIRLFDIVDGQRKEVAASDSLATADRGDEHHRVAHPDYDGPVGLAREAPGLDGDRMGTISESLRGNAQFGPL